MSSSTEAFEYAIKKDVRNNPIVREVDERRLREQWRSVAFGVLFVAVLLFSGWQRVELLQHGYRVEQMQKERGEQERSTGISGSRSRRSSRRSASNRWRRAAASGHAGNRLGDHHRAGRAGRTAVGVRRRERAGEKRMSEPTSDNWRATIRRRLLLAAAIFCCGPSGFRRGSCICRCTSTAISRRARKTSRRARWTFPPSAETSSTGTGACSPTASTATRSTACRVKSRTRSKTASMLCRALATVPRKSRSALAARLRQKRAFVYVRRRVTPPQARRIAELRLEGIGFVKEDRRFYPKKQLAAQLLGFVGVDNKGLAGIEAAYDSQISGAQGKLLYQTDARGRAFSRLERPPTAGATVELTIDEYSAARRRARAARGGGRAIALRAARCIIMDRRRRARFWRWRTSRPSTRMRSRAHRPSIAAIALCRTSTSPARRSRS